ncbi:MAG: multiprotein-bridging factor 1 family protein [Candidatus Micrarchaeota archaeon]
MAECEICGKNADQLFLVSLEGARITVCERCSKHGSVIEMVAEEPLRPRTSRSSSAGAASVAGRSISHEPETALADDYAKIFQQLRQKSGLKQKEFALKLNESESVIKHIEQGTMAPTEQLAKRVEKMFKIKIYAKPKED